MSNVSENNSQKKSKYDLNLKYGIERISVNENMQHLPSKTPIEPIDGKIEDKLKEVLSIKTLVSTMTSSLRPKITDRSILTPSHFKLKLQQVIDSMEQEKMTNKMCNKEVLSDVIKLLEDEQGKSELLDEFRHMLILG